MSTSHTPLIPLAKIDLRNNDLNTHFNFNQPHFCAVCVCVCVNASQYFLCSYEKLQTLEATLNSTPPLLPL